MTDSAAIAGRTASGFTHGLLFAAGCACAIVGFVPVGVGLLVVFTGQATEIIGGSLTLRDMGFATFLAAPFYVLAALLLRPSVQTADAPSAAGLVFAAIAVPLLAVQAAFASVVTLSAPFCVAGLAVPLGGFLTGCHIIAGPVLLATGVGLLALLTASLLAAPLFPVSLFATSLLAASRRRRRAPGRYERARHERARHERGRDA